MKQDATFFPAIDTPRNLDQESAFPIMDSADRTVIAERLLPGESENIALFTALTQRTIDIRAIDQLLENGADPRQMHPYGETDMTCVHIAALKGHTNALALFLKHNEELNLDIRDSQSSTPLHHAAHSGSPQTVMWLLAQGAEPFVTNHESKLPSELTPENNDLRAMLEQVETEATARFTRGKWTTLVEEQDRARTEEREGNLPSLTPR